MSRARGYIAAYKPHGATATLIGMAQEVLEEYRRHWPLTCRQIFYRLVGAFGYDKTEAAYGRLCHHLANARRAKVIPFGAIRDDGVTTWAMDHYDDVDAFRTRVREMAEDYRRNLLASQCHHIEVWCEAAGMLPQLYRVAERYSVPVYSSSGFDSLTAKHRLASRICNIGKPAVILHLGDFDPSGESIFDVIAEDVEAFVMADRPHDLVTVHFDRVALTADQVQIYNLETAPPKASDSRAKAWAGGTCQLEALAPDQIAELLNDAMLAYFDADLLLADMASAREERNELLRGLLPFYGRTENSSPTGGDE